YWNGDINWASAKDIASNRERYIYSTERTITELGIQNSSARICSKGTIVITSRGTVGKMAILPFDMSFNQTCYGLVVKENTDYLYIFYSLIYSLQNIESLTYGTVFDTITMKTFDKIFLPYPDKKIRKTIASILDILDSKIELNKSKNRTLESLAHSLFLSWFVHFDPFQEEEFIDSELGPIPKGWKVERLEKIIEIQNGFQFRTYMLKSEVTINRVIKIKNINNGTVNALNTEFIEEDFANSLDRKFIISPPAILIALTGANIGKIGILSYSTEKLWLNYRLGLIQPKVDCSDFVAYLLLIQNKYQHQIISYAQGSAQPNIGTSVIKKFKFIYPSPIVFTKFLEIIKPIYNKIVENLMEIETFSSLRDLLLPQLLSGKLRIKNPKHFLEEISNEN
ncbi:MAG: restriction endonuclease subunit S, partial [Candidatus Heimdallarchaeota archaeon]|nr:restriction endonuclease subunit S [Candidatus Heimdallarchaeota archaeon]MCK4609747.1 restriction endonuclease subunit S [Candidatus Heimdallarchaeota archaeon]